MKKENGRWIKTIYGKKWKSDDEEMVENMWILILGTIATIVFLITH
jgi:hypothetical protein